MKSVYAQTTSSRVGIASLSGQNLVRIEAESNYSWLIFADGSRSFVAKVLKKFEEELDSAIFIRTHRAHLVNANFVSKYRKGRNASLVLVNGELIPVARRNKRKLEFTTDQVVGCD